MPVADMIGIVRPILRSLRPHDIHGFWSLLDSNDCPLGLEDHAVAFLQDRACRKGNGELQSRVGPASSMSLSPFVPDERKSFRPIAVIAGANVGSVNDFFDNSHAILKKKIALGQWKSFHGITLQQF